MKTMTFNEWVNSADGRFAVKKLADSVFPVLAYANFDTVDLKFIPPELVYTLIPQEYIAEFDVKYSVFTYWLYKSIEPPLGEIWERYKFSDNTATTWGMITHEIGWEVRRFSMSSLVPISDVFCGIMGLTEYGIYINGGIKYLEEAYEEVTGKISTSCSVELSINIDKPNEEPAE